MVRSISEILAETNSLDEVADRVYSLRNNNSEALRAVLTGLFDDRIRWLLPETDPIFRINQLVDQEGAFYREHRKLYLFVEGGHLTLEQKKREALFVVMLENLCPEDARLLLAMKNKTNLYPNINKEIVEYAFPGLLTA